MKKPFENLLSIAKTLASYVLSAAATDLATRVIDLLGEAQPCGVDEPLVRNNGVAIPETWAKTWMSPDETRAMARMLLVAADEAEPT